MNLKMKKSICFFILTILVTSIFPYSSYAVSYVTDFIPTNVKMLLLEGAKIGICDNEFEVLNEVMYKQDGVLMLPANYFFEKNNYQILVSETTFNAVSNNNIVLYNNVNKIKIDGNNIELSRSVVVKNGIWFVPVDICNHIGLTYEIKSNGIFSLLKSGSFSNEYSENVVHLFGIYVGCKEKTSSTGSSLVSVENLELMCQKIEENLKRFGNCFPVYAFIHSGEYFLSKSLNMDTEIFKSDTHKPVYIEEYGDGKPVITGARKLNCEDFKPVQDAKILSRVPKSARKEIAYMDLKPYGIKFSTSDKSYPYIYIDDHEQILSRWPNFDFAKVKEVSDSKSFVYSESEPSKWTKATEAKVYGYFIADYFFGTSNIVSVDKKNHFITLDGIAFSPTRAGARWYAVNLLEAVDLPGEWFVDREEQILYFYPPYSLKDSKIEITTLSDKPMFQLGEAKNISLNGLTFTKGGGSAVSSKNAQNIVIKNCDISFMQGSYALEFSGLSFDVIVDSNECYCCSGGFVFITAGNINNLQNGNSFITNNHVSALGNFPSYINGIVNGGENSYERRGSFGTVVRNNVFQDNNTTYAVSLPGNDVSVDHNEILNQGRNIDDGGAIYFGKSHTFYGVNVSHNYIHDLNKSHSYCALYNDDGYSGSTWQYNVIKDAYAMTINGLGMDETFNYNLGINCTSGMRIGSRMTWGTEVFGDNGYLNKELRNVINSSNGKEFLEKYPMLIGATDRTPYSAPWNSVFYGNVGVNTGGKTTSEMNEITKYGAKKININGKTVDITGLNCTPEGNPHFDYSDDYFVDSKNQDFTIKEDSAIAKVSPMLLNIKMQEIGIIKDREKLLQRPTDGFRLKAPFNGDKSVQTKETVFTWDSVKNATKYRVQIATDKNMNNIVYDTTVMEFGNNNSITVRTLSLDSVYYWRVQAIGIARQNQFVVTSNGPYCFKTVKQNTLDKENLKLAIESAELFYKQLKETKEYKYTESFIKEFGEIINEAKNLYKDSSSQTKIDEIEEKIYYMVNESAYFMDIHYENLDIFDEKKEWKISNNAKMIYNSDETISYLGGSSDATADISNRNSVVCFKMKLDNIVDSEYQGVYFKYNNDNNGYLIVFKKSVIEFQGVGKTFFALPNIYMESGKWYDIQAGAVNTLNGVLQFLKIDGNLLFAKLDNTPNQTREEGKIMIHHRTQGDVHFKKCDSLPKDGIIYEDILSNFNNPFNENHLTSMLIGANDALEINSTFFSVSDKSAISKLLFPDVKEKRIQIHGTDIRTYKEEILKKMVLSAYNSGLYEYVFQNKIEVLYPEFIQLEEIDKNGVTLYDFYKNRINDMGKNDINMASLKKNCKNFEELRKIFAKNIFEVSINSCARLFANDTKHFSEILTKENAKFLEINIDDYIALNDSEKSIVNSSIVALSNSTRSMETIVEQIHNSIKKIN